MVSIDVLDMEAEALQREVLFLRCRVTRLLALLRLVVVAIKVAEFVKVKLRKGTNEVQGWLTNRVGVTRGAWNFAFPATTPEGIIIHPNAE